MHEKLRINGFYEYCYSYFVIAENIFYGAIQFKGSKSSNDVDKLGCGVIWIFDKSTIVLKNNL